MGREGAKAKAGTSKSRLPGLNWEELRNVTFWVDLIAENATSFFFLHADPNNLRDVFGFNHLQRQHNCIADTYVRRWRFV